MWELNNKDLSALDRNEGYQSDRAATANPYNRVQVTVNFDGERLEAETYVASPQEGLHLPNAAYLGHLREGAKHHGLPDAYLTYLAALPDDQSAS